MAFFDDIGYKMAKARLVKLVPGERYQRLLNKDTGTRRIKSGYVRLGPGENVGRHTTGGKEEVIIVLEGSGEARIGKDEVLKIEHRTVLYVPPETHHDIENTGTKDLEYIFITSDFN